VVEQSKERAMQTAPTGGPEQRFRQPEVSEREVAVPPLVVPELPGGDGFGGCRAGLECQGYTLAGERIEVPGRIAGEQDATDHAAGDVLLEGTGPLVFGDDLGPLEAISKVGKPGHQLVEAAGILEQEGDPDGIFGHRSHVRLRPGAEMDLDAGTPWSTTVVAPNTVPGATPPGLADIEHPAYVGVEPVGRDEMAPPIAARLHPGIILGHRVDADRREIDASLDRAGLQRPVQLRSTHTAAPTGKISHRGVCTIASIYVAYPLDGMADGRGDTEFVEPMERRRHQSFPAGLVDRRGIGLQNDDPKPELRGANRRREPGGSPAGHQ
jgi:hypothetical protein